MNQRHADNTRWYNPTRVKTPNKLTLSSVRSKRTSLPLKLYLLKLGMSIVVKLLDCKCLFRSPLYKLSLVVGPLTWQRMVSPLTWQTLKQLSKPPYTTTTVNNTSIKANIAKGIALIDEYFCFLKLTLFLNFQKPNNSDGVLVL